MKETLKTIKKQALKTIKGVAIYLPMLIGVFLLIYFCVYRFSPKPPEEKKQIFTSSTLMETIDIAELSASRFTYNGIAKVYMAATKEQYQVLYKANIIAGIDLKKVKFEIDNDSKTVKPILPEIGIEVDLIEKEPLSFIPEKITADLNEVLVFCEMDAKEESMEANELYNIAENNIKSIIEALLYPILDSQEYTLIWE